jgi:hypothetical protein
MAEGKRIFREACNEKSWNVKVSEPLRRDWFRWTRQLRNVRVSRSVANNLRKIKAAHLHTFADASNLACSCITKAVIEHAAGTMKCFLASESRISKRGTSIWG